MWEYDYLRYNVTSTACVTEPCKNMKIVSTHLANILRGFDNLLKYWWRAMMVIFRDQFIYFLRNNELGISLVSWINYSEWQYQAKLCHHSTRTTLKCTLFSWLWTLWRLWSWLIQLQYSTFLQISAPLWFPTHWELVSWWHCNPSV